MPGLQARQTDAGIMQPTGVRALLVVAATVFILSAAGCTGARMPHQATTRSSVSPSPAATSSVCECCRSWPTARTRTGAAAARARRSALAHDRRVRHGGSGSWAPIAAAVEPRGPVSGDHPPCSEGLHGGSPCVRCCHAPERSCVRAKCVRHDHQHHRWLLPAGGTAAARVAPVGDGESRVALLFASDR